MKGCVQLQHATVAEANKDNLNECDAAEVSADQLVTRVVGTKTLLNVILKERRASRGFIHPDAQRLKPWIPSFMAPNLFHLTVALARTCL